MVRIGSITDEVRYIGVDTPERGDWLYEDATKFNEGLVSGKTVRLERDVSERDKFGRLARYVYLDGLSVSAELIRAGLARVYPYPPDIKHQALFKQLEIETANSAKGLWAKPQIVDVFYNGLKSGEPDEYVEIANFSGKSVNMTGWKLKDKKDHTFTFPSCVVEVGKPIRVYTNESHPEWGGFSFKSAAIWNNDGDEAVLYNGQGKLVSRMGYKGVQ